MKLASRIFRNDRWYVTSRFGWRKDPISGVSKFHNGCDYGTYGKKIPQYALEDGIVEQAGKDSTGGIFAWVLYPRLGIRLLHYHLDSVAVRKGQKVNENTIIGYTGTTGYSTGVHLHLGMKRVGNSSFVDPDVYNYQPAPVKPVEPVKDLKFKKGDKVIFTGVLYGNSYGGNPGQSRNKLNAVIELVNPSGSKPYNINNGLGWVGEEDLVPYVELPKTDPLPPKEEPLPVVDVKNKPKVGDTVIVTGRGKSDSFGGGATTRMFENHKMRVLIDKSSDNRPYPYACNQYNQLSGVTAWFKAEDVKKQ